MMPSIWSATNEQLGQPSCQSGPNMKWYTTQLAAALEKVRQRALAVGGVEDIVLLDPSPKEACAVRR